MPKSVVWPGVAVKTAKGRKYHYWTRSTPWVRMPDPATAPDKFMRKLAELERVAEQVKEPRIGTLGDAIRNYRKHPDFLDLKPNTKKLYGIYLTELERALPQGSLTEITPQLVQRYVMDENADRRGAANVMLKVLHIVFLWSMGRRQGLSDPTMSIKPYKIGEHEAWPDHILEAALKSEDHLFRLAVKLHLYTGQRTGDVCRMTWNVITAEGRIPVKQEKTDTPLLIPMHPDLMEEIAATPRSTLTILANKMTSPLKPPAFREWVEKFATDNGLNAKLVPHGLRKNAVNALLECGCSTGEVSSITGQSLQMVEYYARQRNQTKMADVAMLKWGAEHKKNGKTFVPKENSAAKSRKS